MKNETKSTVTATCRFCGRQFVKSSNSTKYCSKECADNALKAARRRHRAEISAVLLAPRVCPQCGKTFKPHKVMQTFCSGLCAVRAKRAKEIASRTIQKTCPMCGKTFMTSRSDRIFCSPQCGKKSAAIEKYKSEHGGMPPARRGRPKAITVVDRTKRAAASAVAGITEDQRAKVLADLSLPDEQRFRQSMSWTRAMRSYAKKVWMNRYDRCSSFNSNCQ